MKILIRSLFGGALALFVLTLMSLNVWAQVEDSLPDLLITDVVLPQMPKPLQIFDIAVTVKNAGQADAGPFRVALRINSTLTKRVEGLNAGESTTVTFSWFGPRGSYALRVEADAFAEVVETNDKNNTARSTFVLAVDPLPDLLVQSVRLSPQYPLPGTSATLEVVVSNVGLLATTSRASLRVKDGTTTLRTLFVDPLEPGQNQTFNVAWRPNVGENFLSLEVDTLKRIPELDESNNVLTQVVTISARPPTGANLVIRNLEVFPPDAAPGEVVTIRATVVNVGQGIAQDFSVGVEADGTLLDAVPFNALAPGAQGQVETTWVATAGERLIRVKADGPTGTVIETDETDNVSVTLIEVGTPLNRCGQLVYLQLDEEAASKLTVILNLNREQVFNTFMPKVKQAMETDFAGINVRFTLSQPLARHSTVHFVAEAPSDRLGEAPLDFNNRFKNDVATVFIGSFELGLSRGEAFHRSLDTLATALANTASHEAGHFLGLPHDDEATSARFNRQNMMANGTDTFSAALFDDAFFTPENLDYLRGILPLTCAG